MNELKPEGERERERECQHCRVGFTMCSFDQSRPLTGRPIYFFNLYIFISLFFFPKEVGAVCNNLNQGSQHFSSFMRFPFLSFSLVCFFLQHIVLSSQPPGIEKGNLPHVFAEYTLVHHD